MNYSSIPFSFCSKTGTALEPSVIFKVLAPWRTRPDLIFAWIVRLQLASMFLGSIRRKLPPNMHPFMRQFVSKNDVFVFSCFQFLAFIVFRFGPGRRIKEL